MTKAEELLRRLLVTRSGDFQMFKDSNDRLAKAMKSELDRLGNDKVESSMIPTIIEKLGCINQMLTDVENAYKEIVELIPKSEQDSSDEK